jgi:hypothetical protein
MKFVKQSCAVLVSSCMVLGIAREAFADQADQPVVTSAQAMLQTPEQLQQLVAPIALYPDALVAQILAASGHAVEIVEADRWMQAHSGLNGDALAVEVDKQRWDPSVQALTEFPSVLANLDQNLDWASSLGDAYLIQPQALMNAVQVMRQRAEQAGNLASTGQETVSSEGPTITIDPADSGVVYVPQYDPWLVYGAPIEIWPGWYPYSGLYLDGPGIEFGIGFGLGYFGGYSWGWHNWRPDWNHRTVMYNHHAYISRSGSVIDRNNISREGENFNRAAGLYGDRGLYGNLSSNVSRIPQRGFAEPHAGLGGNYGRYGGFINEGVDRGHAGVGRSSLGEMGHGGGDSFGEGFHGGGGGGGGGGGFR